MTLSSLTRRLLLSALAVLATGRIAAAQELLPDIGPPLSPPVRLVLGLGKAAHHAPIIGAKEQLKALGVDLEIVDFNRYADARTAIATGSLDVSTIAAPDLAVLVSQGVTSVMAIRGIASSKKFIIIRNGAKLDTWQDLPALKLAVPPGSAVWFQFIAKLQEVGLGYDKLKVVNVQGAGNNFVQALQRGDVDAFIHAEPFETMPVIEKTGHPATSLDYSDTKAMGSELGLFVATKPALSQKREAVRRFFWVYMRNEKELQASPEKFVKAIEAYFGVSPEIAELVAPKITLGGVSDAASLSRMAKFLSDNGVIQQDISAKIPDFVDTSLIKSIMKP